MKTKKILAFAVAAIMALSMSVTAFAETNSVTLTYSNEATYEISIPESATINQSTGKGTIVVNIDDANLADDSFISVTATSANYDNGWYLVNANDSSDKLAYTIGTTDGGSDVASGDKVLSDDGAASAILYVTVSDTSKVGIFTDTITFTSEIKKIISFTVGNTSFQAEDGMTWGEWVDSEYNVDGYYHDGLTAAGAGVISPSGARVYDNDVLINNGVYTIDVSSFPGGQ